MSAVGLDLCKVREIECINYSDNDIEVEYFLSIRQNILYVKLYKSATSATVKQGNTKRTQLEGITGIAKKQKRSKAKGQKRLRQELG